MNQKIGSALIILLLTVGKIAGQSIDFSSEIKTIESLILEDNLPQADTVLQISIERAKPTKPIPNCQNWSIGKARLNWVQMRTNPFTRQSHFQNS